MDQMTALQDSLKRVIADALGTTPERVQEYIEQRREVARRRVERRNSRYAEALASLTDVQSVLVDKFEADTCEVNKLYVSRQTRRVAVMMVKWKVWWPEKGKIGRKIIMIYPDGTTSQTFEKTISVRKDF